MCFNTKYALWIIWKYIYLMFFRKVYLTTTNLLSLCLFVFSSFLILSFLVCRVLKGWTSYVLAQEPWVKEQTEHLIKYKPCHPITDRFFFLHPQKWTTADFSCNLFPQNNCLEFWIWKKTRKRNKSFFPDALTKILFHVGKRRGLEFGILSEREREREREN